MMYACAIRALAQPTVPSRRAVPRLVTPLVLVGRTPFAGVVQFGGVPVAGGVHVAGGVVQFGGVPVAGGVHVAGGVVQFGGAPVAGGVHVSGGVRLLCSSQVTSWPGSMPPSVHLRVSLS